MKKFTFIVPLIATSLLASCNNGGKKTTYYLTKANYTAPDSVIQVGITYLDGLKGIIVSHNDSDIEYSFNRTLILNDNYQLIKEEYNVP